MFVGLRCYLQPLNRSPHKLQQQGDISCPADSGERLYPLMVLFIASGPIIRMKYDKGSPPCDAACNPSTDLLITYNNKVTPHLRHEKRHDHSCVRCRRTNDWTVFCMKLISGSECTYSKRRCS
ncbi:unnamed protein product [Ectocarpus sp. 6 AP-2014]